MKRIYLNTIMGIQFLLLCSQLFSITFAERQIVDFPNITNPNFTISCDLDNNGFSDAISASLDNKLVWFPRTNSQIDDSIEEEIVIAELPANMGEVTEIKCADFDDDDDLDLLVASESKLYLVENIDSCDSFVLHLIQSFETEVKQNFDIGDYNSDGLTDFILARGEEESTINIFLNTNNLTFSQTQIAGNGIPLVISYDKDNDGDLDLFANCNGFNYLENVGGDSLFVITDTLSTEMKNAQIIDFDNDGNIDIAGIINDEELHFGWIENNDDSFSEFEILFIPEPFTQMKIVNSDSDDDYEIFFIKNVDLFYYDYISENNYEFVDIGIYTSTFVNDSYVSFFDFADFDNDNDIDILISFSGGEFNFDHRFLGICENVNGLFGNEHIFNPSFTQSPIVTSFDIDCDSDLDLLMVNGQNIYWSRKNGAEFDKVKILYHAEDIVRWITIRDINFDGKSDIILMFEDYPSDGDYKVLLNNSDGETDFSLQPLNNIGIEYSKSYDFIDLDQDNDLDFICIKGENNRLYWSENLGNYTFGNSELLLPNQEHIVRFKFTDIDNDGDLDLLAGTEFNYSNRFIFIATNNNLNFTITTNFPELPARPKAFYYEDLDNDGNYELIVHVDGYSEMLYIYKNISDNFQDYELYILNTNTNWAHGIRMIRFADLDNDGDKDLIAGRSYYEEQYSELAILVWTNNQSESYFDESHLAYPLYHERAIGLRYINIADYNSDGKQDIFCYIYRQWDEFSQSEWDYYLNTSTSFQNFPSSFELMFPQNYAENLPTRPEFIWTASTDNDPNDFVEYQIEIATDSLFNEIVFSESEISDTLFIMPNNLSTNTQYFWRVIAEDTTGNQAISDFFTFSTGNVTSNSEEIILTKTELKGNYPNPFNPTTTIKFSVKKNEVGKLSIYNVKGQIVKTFAEFSEGDHSVIWNGKNNHGEEVSSGIFFYKLQTKFYQKIKKMILLK